MFEAPDVELPYLVGIPEPTADPASLLETVKALREQILVMTGVLGDDLDRSVRFRDMVNYEFLTASRSANGEQISVAVDKSAKKAVPVLKAKPSFLEKVLQTGFSPDNHLIGYPIVAGDQYKVVGVYLLNSTSNTPNFKFTFFFKNSAGGTLSGTSGRISIFNTNQDGLLQTDTQPIDSGSVIINVGPNKNHIVTVTGAFQAPPTSVIMDMNWAQGSSNAVPTRLKESSWLELVRA